MTPQARLCCCKVASTVIFLACTIYNVVRADDAINYNRDVRPILSDNCYKCHGPDAAERKAGLRLDAKDGAVTKLDSGATAIVPGKIDESELIARLKSTDPDMVMPPASSGKKLTPQQIDTLSKWIEQGRPWNRRDKVSALHNQS